MSYVGGKYEFDLFISYSHGTASTERGRGSGAFTLRDWTRSLADTLVDNLRIALNAHAKDQSRYFSHFLDEREFDSGEPISDTIREAARNSAVLLVLASPYYFQSSYCLDEVRAFFEQARQDGRGLEHCVIREIQPTAAEQWPAELRDPQGRVVNRGEPFFDGETGLPIDLDSFRELGRTPNLSGPRSKLTMAVAKKVRDLKEQIDARELQEQVEAENRRMLEQAAAAASAATISLDEAIDPELERKSIYLQAEWDNAAAWSRAKTQLSRFVLVNPEELKGLDATGPAAPSLLATYEDRRRNMLRFCNGLVLLRAKSEDDLEVQLAAARYDRATLLQSYRRNIPWALIDEVSEEAPVVQKYKIPRIPTALPDWPERLVGALGFSPPAAA